MKTTSRMIVSNYCQSETSGKNISVYTLCKREIFVFIRLLRNVRTCNSNNDAMELIGLKFTFDDKSFKAFLEGGRRIIGDFKSGPSGLDIDRAKTERVDFQHNRNRVLGNIKAVFGYEPTATAYYYDRNESLFASLYPLVCL